MRVEVDRSSTASIREAFKGLKSRMNRGVEVGLRQAGAAFDGQFIRTRLSGPRPEALGRMTGALSKSTHYTVIMPAKASGGDKPGLYYFVGRNAPYARSHEAPPLGTAGKPITPKKGRFLAIPYKSLLTKKPYPFSSPRQESGLVFIPTRGGATGLLVRQTSKAYKRGPSREQTDIVWLLVRSVTIPPRLNLLNDWMKFAPTVVRYLKTNLDSQLKGTWTRG